MAGFPYSGAGYPVYDPALGSIALGPFQWYVSHKPAAGIRASAEKLAPGPKQRHIITGAFFNLFATTGVNANAVLNNAISGVFSNIIVSSRLFVLTNQSSSLFLTGLNIELLEDTAACAQFESIAATHTQSCSLFGYTIGV